ncbi:uncharacterized protein LOC117181786 [Belonocnema kinseyi]|uniref:uncharacterized protein LOC117181786 n=1 Tax=Belonocnema kinseyi TaxID=2817044 RepID=UPI00143D3772|nr:uncharacterized protein LOC117181786 [Belonocnema kinseyi]
MNAEGENRVLDAEQWRLEAQAVIDDVKNHVRSFTVSEKLQSTNRCVYLNLTTLEDLKFCIELSGNGFSILGKQHDDTSDKGDEYFETPYSLLNFLSPQYRDSFANCLLDKLNQLNGTQDQEL